MWMNIVLGLIALLTFAYFWTTRNYGYFSSRGVFEMPASFPFGTFNSWNLFTQKKSFLNGLDDVYNKYKQHKLVGSFSLSMPLLIINDMEIIKNVLIKDWDHFVDRRVMSSNPRTKAAKMFSQMLTVLKGDKWKKMRSTLSPVFTSGKLKSMTSFINKVGEDFVICLNKYSDNGEEFLGKEMMTSYTLDAIAKCGLGVEAKAFTEPEGLFRKTVAKITNSGKPSPKQMIKLLILVASPWLADLLGISFLDEDSVEFFEDVIHKSLEQRRRDKIRRNDFIDLALDALKNAENENKETENDQFEKDAAITTKTSVKIDETEFESLLVSNTFLLFFAGFDTSSTIMGVGLHYLAKYPDVQERLYQEIYEAFERNDGSQDLDYNTIQSMEYLDKFVHETLRMYPLTPLERLCVKDYKIPETDFVVPKGMLVQIATGAIMKDEQYFPNPLEFNPENFSPESKAQRNPYAFLSFGQGPRNCIGMRFALLQVKVSLIRAVGNFLVSLGPSAPRGELIPDPLSPSGQPIGGIWLTVKKRS